MKILVTGAQGQFGRHFQDLCPSDWEAVPSSRGGPHAMDLSKPGAMAPVVAAVAPDWIVHAGAMTDVDGCERDPGLAEQVNGEATGEIAAAAADAGAKMVYISTDYVFDGTKGDYKETDPTGPASVYGKTKLLGETLASGHLRDVLIARTSVVFGPHKNNFVSWAAGCIRNGTPMKIVKDQIVTPTYTGDLVRQVIALIRADANGIYHTAGATRCSRLEMVQMVGELMGIEPDLEAISMADMDWSAPRPRDSSLATTKVAVRIRPMPLSEALRSFLQEAP